MLALFAASTMYTFTSNHSSHHAAFHKHQRDFDHEPHKEAQAQQAFAASAQTEVATAVQTAQTEVVELQAASAPELAAPVSAKHTPGKAQTHTVASSPLLRQALWERYLTFTPNQGRLNNNLRSLDATARWAKALNRTLYIPNLCITMQLPETDPDRVFWTSVLGFAKAGNGLERMVYCKNMYLGFADGLWDLGMLREHFKVVLAEDVIKEYGSVAQHPVLGKAKSDCMLGVDGGNPFSAPDILAGKDPRSQCAFVLLSCGGVFPWNLGHTEKFSVPRTSFFDVLRPAAHIRNAAAQYLGTIKRPGFPFVTLHLRTFEESIRYETQDIMERRKRARTHCLAVIGRQTRWLPAHPHDSDIGYYCTLIPETINTALAAAKIPAIRREVPWFFAGSDELDGTPLVVELKSLGATQLKYSEFYAKSFAEGGSVISEITDSYVKRSAK
eukprot:gene2924-3736_t